LNTKVKALKLLGPFRLEFVNVDMPDVPEGFALIKINSVSICGTDIHGYKGKLSIFKYPVILGHEICGTVIKINGECDNIALMDKVVIVPYMYCGNCIACQKGCTNCCKYLHCMGVHSDGGLQEYISVPMTALVKVPENLDSTICSLIEPYAVSLHGVKRAGIKDGQTVIVVGAGPIGIGAAEFASIKGAKVIILDVNATRNQYLSSKFGFEILNPLDQGFMKTLLGMSSDDFADVVIDATGNSKSMANSLNYVAHTGILLYLGISSELIEFNDISFHSREASLIASRNSTNVDFIQVIESISSGKIKPERFITHHTHFSSADMAFMNWFTKNQDVFKAVITF